MDGDVYGYLLVDTVEVGYDENQFILVFAQEGIEYEGMYTVDLWG